MKWLSVDSIGHFHRTRHCHHAIGATSMWLEQRHAIDGSLKWRLADSIGYFRCRGHCHHRHAPAKPSERFSKYPRMIEMIWRVKKRNLLVSRSQRDASACDDSCDERRASYEWRSLRRTVNLCGIECARLATPHAQLAPNIGPDVAAPQRIERPPAERSTGRRHMPHGKRPPIILNASSQTDCENSQLNRRLTD